MTTHHAISVAAGNVLEESRELVALGPALTAQRLEEGIRAIRLSLASLEALQRKLGAGEDMVTAAVRAFHANKVRGFL